MSTTSDVLTGLAQILATAVVGTYRADDSAYLASETGIGFGELPQGCDRAIALTDYLTANDSPDQPLGTIGVQVMSRGLPGDRLDAASLRDQIFTVLHGMTHVQLGGVHVIQALRASSLPMGADTNLRWQDAQNFYLDVNTAATAYRT